MKQIYKTFLLCIITAIITAGATIFIIKYQDPDIEMLCKGGASPDLNGCCPGEEFTDMGDYGYNCCPLDGGDCFPPIQQ